MKFFISFLLAVSVGVAGFFTWSWYRSHTACANSESCVKVLDSVVENNTPGVFLGQTVAVPQISEAQLAEEGRVLGETEEEPGAEKHIFIDLDAQKLYAYEGQEQKLEMLTSTGRWGWTPTGDYRIWIKIRATRMSGGSGNSYYNLPNVPYTMFFANDQVAMSRGYAIHGAYWHNNFGTPMSHGCVNLREVDAKQVYDWASPTTKSSTTRASSTDPGTLISICDQVEIREGDVPLCLR